VDAANLLLTTTIYPGVMVDLLALPSLSVLSVRETLASLEFDVELRDVPCCSHHPAATPIRNGREEPIRAVADIPMRGKAVWLTQRRHQYQCRECAARISTRSLDFHPDKAMTKRLVRYVEDAVLRRAITDIASETGLSPKQIRPIAEGLYKRLQGFEFATPDVVAMDAIYCSRTQIYQVVSNGRTGDILDVFRESDADAAATRLGQVVDIRSVRIFVTDMHETNIAIAKTFRAPCRPLHVADKFHVLEKCNSAVFTIVGDQIKILKERGLRRSETALRSMQPMLAWRRTPVTRRDPTFDFDNSDLPKRWTAWQMVNAAHRARWQLQAFYKCNDRESARAMLDEFRYRASQPLIANRMKECVDHIKSHEVQILNYFDALEFHPDGRVWGPTTNAAERKNGDLRDLWEQSRGFSGPGTAKQFWLKAVFHPYRLDRHLVECANCSVFVGPLAPQIALDRASTEGDLPGVWCTACSDRIAAPARGTGRR
jgi:transposase